MAQRRLAAVTAHPEPFFAVREANRAPSLRAQVGRAVSFNLAIPQLARWSDVTVANLAVRIPGDTIETLPVPPATSRGAEITYTFPTAGAAMLMFCAGPKGNAPDPTALITHCSKVIIRVGDQPPGPEADGFTSTTGLLLDVVPMVSPARVEVGTEFPVRFHYENQEQPDIDVAAIRPDGSIDQQMTSPTGIANFKITQSGRWLFRFVKSLPGGDRVGELVFEIPEKMR